MVICQYNSYVPTECKDQYFADTADCTKFYVCVHGQPMSWTCPSPLHWNDQHKTCDWDYSANCVAANNNQQIQQPPQQVSQWEHQTPSHQVSPWISAQPIQPVQPINHWGQEHQPQQPQQQPNQQWNDWGHGQQANNNNGYIPSASPQANHQDGDYPEYEDEEPMHMNQNQPSHGQPDQSVMPAIPNQTSSKCGPEKKSVCYCEYQFSSFFEKNRLS